MDTTKKDKKTILKNLVHRLSMRCKRDPELRPLHTVRGHFSLTDIRGAKFPGRQTAATSLCALLQATSLCPSSWSAEVIDRLLLQGDKLHSTRVRHLKGRKSGPGTGTLTAQQLPTQLSTQHREFSLKFESVNATGFVQPGCKLDHTNKLAEKTHLEMTLKTKLSGNKYGVLLTSGIDTVAVMTDNIYVYVFHPCMESSGIVSTNCSKSALLKFRDLSHLVTYLYRKVTKQDMSISLTRVDVTITFDIWTDFAFSRSLIYV